MKIKTFEAWTPIELDPKINDFMDHNEFIEIIDKQVDVVADCGNTGGILTHVTIWYK